jgi:VWFA-related protein
MKLFTSVSLLFLLAVSALAQTPQATPPEADKEVIRIGSQLVLVDALVLDKKGNQITNLNPEDFEVLQDGKLQKIVNFAYLNRDNSGETSKTENKKSVPPPPFSIRSNRGRVITFVIDDGNCLATIDGLDLARDAINKFIDRQMLPDDKVAIYRTRGGSSLLQLYSSNKEVLKRIVNKVNWVPSACGSAFEATKNDSTYKGQISGEGKGTFESKEDKEFRTQTENFEREKQVVGTVGVLNFVVERLKNLPERKIVFFLSEGIPMPPGSYSVDVLREVGDKALRSSVVIYTMSEKGLTIPGMIEARDEVGGNEVRDARIQEERSLNDGLAYLAYTTGGEFIRNNNYLDTSIKEVLNKETGYYLIGYQPDDETFKGKDFHKIEVRVKRPDLKISARKGFYGRAETESKSKNKNAETPLYQAIASPLRESGMDIRLTTLVGNDPTQGNFIRALLHIKGQDLTFIDEPDGTKKVVLDIVAVTLDEKGKVIDEYNRSYPIHIPAKGVQTVLQNGLDYSADIPIKKSGIYSFRLAVRDNNSKRLGSAGDFIEIPDLKKGKLFMSGLIATSMNDGKPVLPKNRPANTAFSPVFMNSIPSIRQYSAGDTLSYAYSIYNAKPDPTTKQPKITRQIRLYKNGKLLIEGKETPVVIKNSNDLSRIDDDGIIRIIPNTEAGEYVLQVVVKDTVANKSVSQWIDFEVIQ